MAPADDPNALLYTPCSHSDATLKCQNEGWLYCTICHRYWCEDHACEHVSPQVNSDAVKDVQGEHGTLDASEPDSSDESHSFFRELSPQQLQDAGEIALRSYFRRLLSEAKRIQREIERRMIYATEMMGPEYRRKHYLSQDAIDALRERAKKKADLTPLGLLEREAREARAKELQRKRNETIKANLDAIIAQIKLGNITPEQALAAAQKGKAK